MMMMSEFLLFFCSEVLCSGYGLIFLSSSDDDLDDEDDIVVLMVEFVKIK